MQRPVFPFTLVGLLVLAGIGGGCVHPAPRAAGPVSSLTFGGDAAGEIGLAERGRIIALATRGRDQVRHLDLWRTMIGVHASVYLQPDPGPGPVQRGRMVELIRINRLPVPPVPDWTLEGESRRQQYAVIAVDQPPAGGMGSALLAAVGSEPFAVVGAISDETLLGLVKYLRVPPVPTSREERQHDGTWRVTVSMIADTNSPSDRLVEVERRGDGTWRVAFLRSGESGLDLILRLEAGA